MTSIDELRDRLKKPLLLELRLGCQDNAVVGGIEKLVATVGKPFADVQKIVTGYGDLEVEQRQERLEQAIALLGGAQPLGLEIEERVQGAGFRVQGTDQTSELRTPNPEPLLPSDFLDHDLTAKTLDLGAQAPKKLGTIGIKTYRDLLYYFPRRYEDRRTLPHFGMLKDQEASTVIGVVTGRKAMKARTGMNVLRAFLEDD